MLELRIFVANKSSGTPFAMLVLFASFLCAVSSEHKFVQLWMIILAVNLKIYSHFNIYCCFFFFVSACAYRFMIYTLATKPNCRILSSWCICFPTHTRSQSKHKHPNIHPSTQGVHACVHVPIRTILVRPHHFMWFNLSKWNSGGKNLHTVPENTI